MGMRCNDVAKKIPSTLGLRAPKGSRFKSLDFENVWNSKHGIAQELVVALWLSHDCAARPEYKPLLNLKLYIGVQKADETQAALASSLKVSVNRARHTSAKAAHERYSGHHEALMSLSVSTWGYLTMTWLSLSKRCNATWPAICPCWF